MRTMIVAICGAVLASCVLLFALRHHVVLAEDGILLLSKRQYTLNDTYVDLRDAITLDWVEHPALVQAVYLTR